MNSKLPNKKIKEYQENVLSNLIHINDSIIIHLYYMIVSTRANILSDLNYRIKLIQIVNKIDNLKTTFRNTFYNELVAILQNNIYYSYDKIRICIDEIYNNLYDLHKKETIEILKFDPYIYDEQIFICKNTYESYLEDQLKKYHY